MLLFSLQYLKTEIFYKEKSNPFSGDFFYNPYKGYSSHTLKANFHAHSRAWFRITSGSQQPDDVYRFYKSHGYDIISLSNYQKITTDEHDADYIPVYEHGHNLGKSHQLILNGGETIFFDFPFVAGYNNRQQVINRLREGGGLIVLAHPGLPIGYRKRDMKYLKGYDFIEVFNTFAISDKLWDTALSSGYPAWILAGDDCHDISQPELCLNCWNRISTTGRTPKDVLNALKKGCSYGVMNMNHEELNFLDSCRVSNGIVNVFFRNKADLITFIADNGTVKKKVRNSPSASYKISNEDTYVRVSAKNGTQVICLNPVIRYDGVRLNYNNGYGHVNNKLTALVRIMVIIISLALIIFLLLINSILYSPFHKIWNVFHLKNKE